MPHRSLQPHLVAEGQVGEDRQVFGPFHRHEEETCRGLIDVFRAGRWVRCHLVLARCPLRLAARHIHRLIGCRDRRGCQWLSHHGGNPLPTSSHPPSSGSSLAQVSAVIRLAMKRWLVGGVDAWGPGVTAAVALGPRGAGQGLSGTSRVVATCSGGSSASSSMLSSRTWAVLRGWRSFCTAAGTWWHQHQPRRCQPLPLSPCVPTTRLTVLVHAGLQALLEPAGLALVAVRLVHRAQPCPRLAPTGEVGPDCSPWVGSCPWGGPDMGDMSWGALSLLGASSPCSG